MYFSYLTEGRLKHEPLSSSPSRNLYRETDVFYERALFEVADRAADRAAAAAAASAEASPPASSSVNRFGVSTLPELAAQPGVTRGCSLRLGVGY